MSNSFDFRCSGKPYRSHLLLSLACMRLIDRHTNVLGAKIPRTNMHSHNNNNSNNRRLIGNFTWPGPHPGSRHRVSVRLNT